MAAKSSSSDGAHAPAPVRVTEASNPVTVNIDTASPVAIVRQLGTSDAQLFSSFGGHPGLTSSAQLQAMACTVDAMVGVLTGGGDAGGGAAAGEGGAVVCTGSGTSGRLAYFVARAMNAALARLGHPPRFHYLIAGGDHALIKAKEGAEDDPDLATRDLLRLIEEHRLRRVVVIGITCSMSAAYVRSHLEYAMDTDNFVPVLLGFNPVAAAKPPPGDCKRDIVAELGKLACPGDAAQGVVINPVVGPEPIAGSTRMKGGSATKMILEAMCSEAVARAYGASVRPVPPPSLARLPKAHRQLCAAFNAFERAYRLVYLQSEAIAGIVAAAAEALRAGGRIVYLGAGTAAILGLVDASECPPTYGAAFTDVRGFVQGGWETMAVDSGDLSEPAAPVGEAGAGGSAGAGASGGAPVQYYNISLSDYERSVVPTLTGNDCVVQLGIQAIHPDVVALATAASTSCPSLHTASVLVRYGDALADAAATPAATGHVVVDLDEGEIADGVPAFAEFALKLVLNAITTGAHVRKGTVYQNRMINLMVTNQKLFHRAAHIVATFSGVSTEAGTDALIRAIHRVDAVTEALRALPVGEHVTVASSQARVVPLALLLAKRAGELTVTGALTQIAAEPVLRRLVTS